MYGEEGLNVQSQETNVLQNFSSPVLKVATGVRIRVPTSQLLMNGELQFFGKKQTKKQIFDEKDFIEPRVIT